MAKTGSASNKAVSARQAAAQLRAKQRAAARRMTLLFSLGAVALVALFAVAIMYIVKTGEESGPYAVPNSGELKVPSVADDDDAIVIGPGGVIGEAPPEGAIAIELVEDPLCPWCRIFDEAASDEVEYLISQGEASLRYHIVSILDGYSAGTHYSTRMANAWITTAEYDPDHFWAFVRASFTNQPEENAKGLTNDEIADVARDAGVSGDAVGRFADGEFTQWLIASTDRAVETFTYSDPTTGQAGFGTPTVTIAGVHFPYWTTSGNISAGVAYVKDNGAAAFADYLANPPEPSPSPSPSGSA
jgi:protein-disulfide isomerase